MEIKQVFKENKQFKDLGWERFDILDFEVGVEKGQLLDFDLIINHLPDYAYDYLDVNITFYTPSGASLSRNYHFNLKDKNHNWKSTLKDNVLQANLVIRKEMTLSKTGICKVRIENKMTKIETPGIISIGLQVKEN